MFKWQDTTSKYTQPIQTTRVHTDWHRVPKHWGSRCAVVAARHLALKRHQSCRWSKHLHSLQCSISTSCSSNNSTTLDTIKPWRFSCAPTSCCGRGDSIWSWLRGSRYDLRIFVIVTSSINLLTFSAGSWHLRCTTIIRFLKDRILSTFTDKWGQFLMECFVRLSIIALGMQVYES